MKILIATAVYYPQINGVAVFSHNLAVGLAKRGHEVMVICPSQTGKHYEASEDGVKVQYLRSVDVKVYPDQISDVPTKKKIAGLELPRLFYKKGFRVSVFPQQQVNKILKDFKPDVVHVQVSDPIGLSVVWSARRMGIPIVTTEHNQPEVLTEPLKIPSFIKKPANALLYAYFTNRQSKSDFVTMPTRQAINNLLSRHEIKVPVAAVSNGVDLKDFKPGRAKAGIYDKYSIPKGVPIVLYVGRVDPEKRVETVIKAFKEARKFVPTVEMVVVGDGVDRTRLENKYGDEVSFLGRVMPPDLYEIYKVGTVFATASEIETQGIVLIEAAATGLPLIAVDKGAVGEVCIDGENGALCSAGDEAQMAEAMVRILSDVELQKEYAKNSLKIAEEHDFERTLDRFENIYQRVINSKLS